MTKSAGKVLLVSSFFSRNVNISLAASHGTDFIRINTICPGAVLTNLASGATGEINPAYKETVERILARTMMNVNTIYIHARKDAQHCWL